MFINKNLQIFIFFTDLVACFPEKFIMASVRKRKGTKTYLTMGKKGTKYRRISQGLNLQQSLNSEQILEQPISLEADEGITNQINIDFTQAQPIELNHVTQTTRSKSYPCGKRNSS